MVYVRVNEPIHISSAISHRLCVFERGKYRGRKVHRFPPLVFSVVEYICPCESITASPRVFLPLFCTTTALTPIKGIVKSYKPEQAKRLLPGLEYGMEIEAQVLWVIPRTGIRESLFSSP